LLTDAEFAKTAAAVTKFVTDGSGAELQRQLVARAAEKSDSSWFIDWWNEMAYFGDPEPVVFYVSYFYQFKQTSVPGTNVERAAKFIKATLAYRELINSEMLAPEMAGKDPVDMSMYPFLFNSCRMPNTHENGNIDWAETYDPAPHSHVIVIRKNKYYSFDTVVDGKELSAAEIQQTLAEIVEQAGNSTGAGLGLLTAEERPTWNKARDLLMKDSLNKVCAV
jgi:carnitine O-acetyltransferase